MSSSSWSDVLGMCLISLVITGCSSANVGETSSLLSPLPGCELPAIPNGGFESGTLDGWSSVGRVTLVSSAHTGSWSAEVSPKNKKPAKLSTAWIAPPASSTLSLAVTTACAGDARTSIVLADLTDGSTDVLLDECTSNSDWRVIARDLSPHASHEVELRIVATRGKIKRDLAITVDDINVALPPPVVSIPEPVGDVVTSLPVQVTAEASVHPCTTLANLSLTVDGQPITSDASSPVGAAWSGSQGSHVLSATGTDGLGRSTTVQRTIYVATGCPTHHEYVTTAPAPVDTLSAPVVASTAFGRMLFYGFGSTLHVRDMAGGSVGAVSIGSSIVGNPAVARLGDGYSYVFASTDGGYLHKLRVSSSSTISFVQAAYFGRGAAVCPSDSLGTPPALQLAAYSNPGYTGGDRVFVGTAHGCGDHSQNRILGLDAASTNTIVWDPNAYGEYQIDAVTGCLVDYDTNRLYCTAELEPGRYQNTLFALDTNTGELLWARNLGALAAPPAFNWNNRHLYVASTDGTLYAIDPDDFVDPGHVAWQLHVPQGVQGGITLPMWAEFRAPYDGFVFVTDSAGTVHAIWDGGDLPGAGLEMWASAVGATTQPAMLPSEGKLYVGTMSGNLVQLDVTTGSVEATRQIAPSAVEGLTLDYDASGGSLPWRIYATGGRATQPTLKKFCAPFNYASIGS